MRWNKSIKIFLNWFLGPLLFLWLAYSIYTQIRHQPHLETSWLHIKHAALAERWPYLLAALGLMGLNWGLEAAKWQRAVRAVSPIGWRQAFKAVLSGVSFTVTTPNRVGEYLGRMLYMPEGKRLRVVALTVVCSLSQLLVTLLVGAVGFWVLRPELLGLLGNGSHRLAGGVLLVVAGAAGLLYFYFAALERLVERWAPRARWLYLVRPLRALNRRRLVGLLVLSMLRYAVFAAQYLLLFRVFDVDAAAWQGFWMVGLVFLTLSVIPSIALVDLGLRGQVSLQLLGLVAANQLGILLSTVTVWFINLILPAMVGSVLLLGLRLFGPRHPRSRRRLAKARAARLEKVA